MTGDYNPCCRSVFTLLVVTLVVLSGNFLLPLVTPNMHSFAPNHSTVGSLSLKVLCVTRELKLKVNALGVNTSSSIGSVEEVFLHFRLNICVCRNQVLI